MQQSQAGWGEPASADRPTTIDDDVDAAAAAGGDEKKHGAVQAFIRPSQRSEAQRRKVCATRASKTLELELVKF